LRTKKKKGKTLACLSPQGGKGEETRVVQGRKNRLKEKKTEKRHGPTLKKRNERGPFGEKGQAPAPAIEGKENQKKKQQGNQRAALMEGGPAHTLDRGKMAGR